MFSQFETVSRSAPFTFSGTAPSATVIPTASTLQQNPTSLQNLNLKTKYEDTPQPLKQALQAIDRLIHDQIITSEKLDPTPNGELAKRIRDTTRELHRKITAIRNTLERDKHVIQGIRETVNKEFRTAEMASRVVEAYKSRQGVVYYGANGLGVYFWNMANQFESRMQSYRESIEALERHLISIQQNEQPSPETLSEIMRCQKQFFLAITSKVATQHDAVKRLKSEYLSHRKLFGDEKNPFKGSKKTSKANATNTDEDTINYRSIASSTLIPSASVAGLPGAAASAPTAPTAGSSLFGPSMGGGSTSLFGPSTANAGPTTSFAFGGTSTVGVLAGAAKPAGGGLFGATAATAASQPSLFGGTPAPQPTSLFATATTTSQPTGMFGATATSQPLSTGLFGATPSTSQPLFGGAPSSAPPATGGGLFGGGFSFGGAK